jgi:hypothetical protein
MDEREELRRLIDVIERGSTSVSVEQAVDDIRTFANTASFLANKLDARLKRGEAKSKPSKARTSRVPVLPAPSPSAPNSRQPQRSSMSGEVSAATTQADFDRLKPIAPQSPISTD